MHVQQIGNSFVQNELQYIKYHLPQIDHVLETSK